jgi:hypothetical protein
MYASVQKNVINRPFLSYTRQRSRVNVLSFPVDKLCFKFLPFRANVVGRK